MDSAERFASVRALPPLRAGSMRSSRSLDIAARSLFESQALSGSVASVVAEGALDHHFAGLYQFAASRVGVQCARVFMERLETQPECNVGSTDSQVGPGAKLYRALRGWITAAQAATDVPASEPAPFPPALGPLRADAPEWWAPSEEKRARRLVELRSALSPQQAEVLELHFARGLDVPEIAYVLDANTESVEQVLESALLVVDRVFGRRKQRNEPPRELALLQAFALDPSSMQRRKRPTRKTLLQVGDVIHDRYEIEEPLGAGAFADVYRARDREVSDHVVALKILRRPAADQQAVRAALRELQLIASVFHPSIVQLKDHGWHEGHLWFVMPLYRGETLLTRVQRKPLDRNEARHIFGALAEALATMHRAGVRHQDIKPDNVFLANIDPDANNESARVLPVLLDLGVAAKDAELVLAGTPAYFAPEVAARFAGVPDPPPVGPKADVFSLALTLRDALDPASIQFVAAGAVDAFVSYRAVHAATPPSRRDLRDLRAHFERWLHLRPDARPSADEFRHELSALTRPAERRERRIALMRWILPTAVAVCALFGAVVYVLSREASLQRIEAVAERARADRARDRAASIYASLEEEEARRRQLERDVTRLEDDYQSSRMTREQLAARLANVEGETNLLAERQAGHLSRLKQQSEEIRQLRDLGARLVTEADALRRRRDELAAELDRTKAALEGERGRHSETAARADTLSVQLRAAEVVLEDTRARIHDLESRWAATIEASKKDSGGK